MQDFKTQLRQFVGSQPDGASAFAQVISQSHESFFGSGLSESKTNAFCATITGTKNANTFKAIKAPGLDELVSAAFKKVESLCTRTHDNSYGEGYIDFYLPVYSYKPETPDRSAAHIGIWTTVEFDEDEKIIRITQTIKHYAERYGEFTECGLSPTMNKGRGHTITLFGPEADSTTPYQADYLNNDVITLLFSSNDQRQFELYKTWVRSKDEDEHVNKEWLLARILRAIQHIELRRIVDTIGIMPTPDFCSHHSLLALFDGYVPYDSLYTQTEHLTETDKG